MARRGLGDLYGYLTKGELRSVSKDLKSINRKLPKIGMCTTNLPTSFIGKELCHVHAPHHPTGYFFVGFHKR